MRKWMCWVIIFLLITVFVAGCRADSGSDTVQNELWVVTEQTTWDRMNGQTQVLIEQFEQAHGGFTVRLDILPTEEQERAVYLQQLRTLILQGEGPDVYLLPTDGSLILDKPIQYTHREVDLLFEDVELAMSNGLFYDIEPFYEVDEALGKEALHKQVMDAGMIGDARYVLPLRFDMPVIYADVQELENVGFDTSILDKGIDEIIRTVSALNDPVVAYGVLFDRYDVFGELIDYDGGEVLLREEDLAQYLRSYQKLRQEIATKVLTVNQLFDERFEDAVDRGAPVVGKLNIKDYIYFADEPYLTIYVPREISDQETVFKDDITGIEYVEKALAKKSLPLYIGKIEDALDYAPKAKYVQQELAMLPLRSVNGNRVATVTYYAAVGSGCENPEMAYEFVRMFLLEESQWEENRPERSHAVGDKGRPLNTSNSLQYPGMIESGWPVRVVGSVEHMWQIKRLQFYNRYESKDVKARMNGIGLSELLQEDVPVLDANIDQVRFNTELSESLEAAIAQLNDPALDFAPTDVDIDAMAEDLLWELRWHVSEG